jgi:serine/threonine protein kinase
MLHVCVLLTFQLDKFGVAKIIDFGQSRKFQNRDNEAKLTMGIGTPQYMAPELFRGEKYNERVDVYSFSIIMFELYFEKIAFSELLQDPFANLMQFYHMVATKRLRPTIPDPGGDEYLRLSRGEQIYLDLMAQCWSHEPSLRPDFSAINDQLVRIAEMIEK